MSQLGPRDTRQHQQARALEQTVPERSEAVTRGEGEVEAAFLYELDALGGVVRAGLTIRIGERPYRPAGPRLEHCFVPRDLLALLLEAGPRQDRMARRMTPDLDARDTGQCPQLDDGERRARIAVRWPSGLRCRGLPLLERQRLDPLRLGLAPRARDGVVPQKTLALDGVAADEDDSGDGVTLQDRPGEREH